MLQRITLQNFRSYDEREFVFSDTVTMLVGKNGVGKTNALEAVYTLLQGKSFRDGDDELLLYDQEWWKITGMLEGSERELRYQPGSASSKQLLIDKVSKGRFTYRHQLPLVLFEPDDLLLLHASPAVRRQYLDTLLVRLHPQFRSVLAKYNRALLQRNNLLKKELPLEVLRDSVFVWDIALSEYGSEVIARREELVNQCNTRLSGLYSTIAGYKQTLQVTYLQNIPADAQVIAHKLVLALEKDRIRGFTSVGPHRDDVKFVLNGKNAKQTASRGEVRTIVLALKEVEILLIEEALGQAPLYLLDDVLSELDEERQALLLARNTSVQKIITTTHPQTAGSVRVIAL